MGERPLPDEVARAARAYLAALVSPSARADAWHDLLAEVRYWQEDQLVPVLRLAHQVVGQHERVTDEAAAHALSDVARVEVDDLAVVLGASLDTARGLRERVERARDVSSGGRVHSIRALGDNATQPAAAGSAPTSPSPTEDATSQPSTPTSNPAVAPALRIGFDDQDVVDTDASDDDSDDWDDWDDWDDEPPGGLLSYRRLVVIAVVVWVVVVVAWLLGG